MSSSETYFVTRSTIIKSTIAIVDDSLVGAYETIRSDFTRLTLADQSLVEYTITRIDMTAEIVEQVLGTAILSKS